MAVLGRGEVQLVILAGSSDEHKMGLRDAFAGSREIDLSYAGLALALLHCSIAA
jgi:hypothetical protein